MARFEHDVFISYWHGNNELRSEKRQGWIDAFHERLQALLDERLGRKTSVFRDPRIPGNVKLDQYLHDELRHSATFVCIVSPGYLNSDWCMGELREFRRLAAQHGGLFMDGKCRVLKAVKLADPRSRGADFEGTLGYEFFDFDKARQRDHEFDWAVDPYGDRGYRHKLSDLVQDLEAVLQQVRPELKTSTRRDVFAAVKPAGKTVYLAETTSDLRADREALTRELRDRGYEIQPKADLPYSSPAYEDAVRAALRECSLSVHLIGGTYGLVPEGAQGKSIVQLQHDLALAQTVDSSLVRIIWKPEGLEIQDPAQQKLLEHVKASLKTGQNAEYLETPIEALKQLVLRRLEAHSPPPGTDLKKVYVLFHRRDANSECVGEIVRFLRQSGLEVELPLLESAGNDPKAIEIHNRYLVECKGALIYYGKAKQIWFETLKGELEKRAGIAAALGVGTDAGGWTDAIYVTDPTNEYKKLFDSLKTRVIKRFAPAPFEPTALKPFVEALH